MRQLPALLALTFSAMLAACTTQQEQATVTAPTLASASAATPIVNYGQRFLPKAATNDMVVAPEQLAAEVGTRILQEGGNAIDAAVATGFALAVTFPQAGNLAGGGFMLIHLAGEERQTFIDYRESAPAAATRNMFLDDSGEVDRRREYFSHQAAGVPGTVAGMLYALEKYGTLSREDVLAPAIELARDGIPVSYAHHVALNSRVDTLKRNAEATRLFLTPEGAAPPIGSKWVQSDLASTLAAIATEGRDGFYAGRVGQLIADDMAANSGLITLEDLANYQVIEREPVRGTFRDFEVVSAPPPSSGGVHIVQMLNILEGYDLKSLGHNSAAYVHYLAEAMKYAYADRSEYLGDPDYVDVPVAKLTDKAYAARLRSEVSDDRATPSKDIAPGRMLAPESPDTTHYSVADSDGNVVSNTYTLNFSYGSHIAVPGTGVLLNNEMADFAAKPGTANAYGLVQGEANKIEPGKRPLSSMSPTIVLKDGAPWLATGSPGGSVIITTVLQTILNAMEFDMNMATAAAEARLHHQWLPDTLRLERGFSADTVRLLEAMGHPVEVGDRTTGRTNSIMLEDGWLYGASDTRRLGGAVSGY